MLIWNEKLQQKHRNVITTQNKTTARAGRKFNLFIFS